MDLKDLMDPATAARQFADQFPEVYRRFYRRLPPGAYRPSTEAMAILEHLADTGPLTVMEAAKHFGRSQPATSELLDRLQARNLVERLHDERDRRRILVWLTEFGRQQLEQFRSVLAVELLEPVMARLSNADRVKLLEGMTALLAAPLR